MKWVKISMLFIFMKSCREKRGKKFFPKFGTKNSLGETSKKGGKEGGVYWNNMNDSYRNERTPAQQIPIVQVFWLSITNNLNRRLFILLVLFVQGGNIFFSIFPIRPPHPCHLHEKGDQGWVGRIEERSSRAHTKDTRHLHKIPILFIRRYIVDVIFLTPLPSIHRHKFPGGYSILLFPLSLVFRFTLADSRRNLRRGRVEWVSGYTREFGTVGGGYMATACSMLFEGRNVE